MNKTTHPTPLCASYTQAFAGAPRVTPARLPLSSTTFYSSSRTLSISLWSHQLSLLPLAWGSSFLGHIQGCRVLFAYFPDFIGFYSITNGLCITNISHIICIYYHNVSWFKLGIWKYFGLVNKYQMILFGQFYTYDENFLAWDSQVF